MTAVEWLYNQLPDHLRLSKNGFDMLQQAKQMEEEQISESWNDGNLIGRNGHIVVEYYNGEGYYNKTYKK